MASSRVILIDGYNVIMRTATLVPGAGRTLEAARAKLLNLLSWAFGTNAARFIVVFDGADRRGGDSSGGSVEVRFSRPPQKADDLIRSLVEELVDRVERLTVVTSDLEVARHARAMGADIALSDLFLTSALGPGTAKPDEKPTSLSRKELEEWVEIFKARRPGEVGGSEDEGEKPH